MERIAAALREAAAAGPAHRALEVGPGAGMCLPVLAGLFDEVVAADVEDQFLAAARELAAEHPNVTAVHDDIQGSRLAPRSFDLVLCTEVIEHLTDPPGALAAMHAALRPGGRLVLTTPQRHSPPELMGRVAFKPGLIHVARAIYREPVLPTGHVNVLTERELRRRLAAAGFTVTASWKMGVYLPLVAELFGRAGLRLEQWLERRLRGSPLDWLLWTQGYVARA